jgi:hypothetical protein
MILEVFLIPQLRLLAAEATVATADRKTCTAGHHPNKPLKGSWMWELLYNRTQRKADCRTVDALVDMAGAQSVDRPAPASKALRYAQRKTGTFPPNTSGKRSLTRRSVIVVGPDLKMHQCGLQGNGLLRLNRL